MAHNIMISLDITFLWHKSPITCWLLSTKNKDKKIKKLEED